MKATNTKGETVERRTANADGWSIRIPNRNGHYLPAVLFWTRKQAIQWIVLSRFGPGDIDKRWRQLKREGYACVKVEMAEVDEWGDVDAWQTRAGEEG